MAGQVVKVRRETLEACMTCPLCNKLLKEATTISLCLHTYQCKSFLKKNDSGPACTNKHVWLKSSHEISICHPCFARLITMFLSVVCRKCIYEKLSDEEMDCCPVCNIDLGCLPVEKLRPDHNLQDIRAKIFPFKRRKVKAPEVMPSISLPVKRKERSLSSLVVNTPKVSIHTGLTGRRTKAVARKASGLRGPSFAVEEPLKKGEDSAEDHRGSSSSHDSLNKLSHNKRQDSLVDEPPNERRPKEDTKNDVEVMNRKGDLWTPLNCLVEAANRTKSSKSNSQGPSAAKPGLSNIHDNELYVPATKAEAESPNRIDSEIYMTKTKSKEHGHKTKVQEDKNGMLLLPGQVKRRRLRAAGQKKAASSEKFCASGRVMLDAARAKRDRGDNPIWFSLVASEDQKGDVPLPQISACYLRIKDGNVPVSCIQKYLVKKLNLASEAEVEIMCRGEPVLPSLQLHNLVDLWFRTTSTARRIPISVGTSAKDFVMVLSYCRKSSLLEAAAP